MHIRKTGLILFLLLSPVLLFQVQFPYELDGENLVITSFASYDGFFFEDGSGDPVADIACIVVENRGSTGYYDLMIQLLTNEGIAVFPCPVLPAGGRVLIPEKNRMQRRNLEARRIVYSCGTGGESCPDVAVFEAEAGMLCIQNQGEQDYERLTVYYKSFFPEDDLLIGGEGFSLTVSDLKKGESRTVAAEHYLPGASKVIWIENPCRKRDFLQGIFDQILYFSEYSLKSFLK